MVITGLETYTVAPGAALRACSATISACGPPARSCQPSPTMAWSFVSTHPTRGFGVAV